MSDLDHASLEVVKDWFRSHYGPNNAVLVLAGDITEAEARPLVEKYFGDIPAGPKSTPAAAAVPTLKAPVTQGLPRRGRQHDHLLRMWAVPALWARTRRRSKWRRTCSAAWPARGSTTCWFATRRRRSAFPPSVETYERVGEFTVEATVKPGVDPKLVGQQLDAVIADFIKTGPTAEELKRAKTTDVASTIKGLESVGGFGGKAVTLAAAQSSPTIPASTRRSWQEEAALTSGAGAAAAKKWLSRPVFAFTLAPGKRSAYEESKLAGDSAGSGGGAKVSGGAEVGRGEHDRRRRPLDACRRSARSPISNFPTGRACQAVERHPGACSRTALASRSVRVAIDFDAGNAADPKTRARHPGVHARHARRGHGQI